MKKGTFFLLRLLVLAVSCAWTTKPAGNIKKAEWLIGTWESKTSKGSIYEIWSKKSDNELSGKSYILKEKDTIVLETIQLVREQGRLFYVPTVRNQNDGRPVRFASRTISAAQLVFENLQHDFPKIISYAKISKDALAVELSGETRSGQERKQTFAMKRVK